MKPIWSFPEKTGIPQGHEQVRDQMKVPESSIVCRLVDICPSKYASQDMPNHSKYSERAIEFFKQLTTAQNKPLICRAELSMDFTRNCGYNHGAAVPLNLHVRKENEWKVTNDELVKFEHASRVQEDYNELHPKWSKYSDYELNLIGHPIKEGERKILAYPEAFHMDFNKVFPTLLPK